MASNHMNVEETVSPIVEKSRGGLRWFWLIWLAVGLMIGLIAWGLVNNTEIKPQVGSPAPDFEMPLFADYQLEGRDQIALADLRGRVVGRTPG